MCSGKETQRADRAEASLGRGLCVGSVYSAAQASEFSWDLTMVLTVPEDDRNVPIGQFPFLIKAAAMRKDKWGCVVLFPFSIIIQRGCRESGSFGAIFIPCHFSSCFFLLFLYSQFLRRSP